MKPSILLIGTNGQVGRELNNMLPRIGEVTALDRQRLDLTQPEEIRRAIRTFHPAFIVNAAAYTAVDKAESEETAAQAINAEAPGVMAEEARKIGAALIHYSTDYVFDGSKTTPYDEDDPPNPKNVYGRTKLAGERAIQASGARHLIFRTAWVYATEGRNFLLTILRLATQREEIKNCSRPDRRAYAKQRNRPRHHKHSRADLRHGGRPALFAGCERHLSYDRRRGDDLVRFHECHS